MSHPEKKVVHVHKLATSTKILLAAVAIGLAMNAFAPFLHIRETRAQGGMPLGLLSLTCEGVLPEHGEMVKLDCTGATL